MGRPQKPIEQQLAEKRARRQMLDAQLKALEDRQKARDLRHRAKGEKVIMRLLLSRLTDKPEFKTALLAELAAADLKTEEREAAHVLLTGPKPEIATKAIGRAEEAI